MSNNYPSWAYRLLRHYRQVDQVFQVSVGRSANVKCCFGVAVRIFMRITSVKGRNYMTSSDFIGIFSSVASLVAANITVAGQRNLPPFSRRSGIPTQEWSSVTGTKSKYVPVSDGIVVVAVFLAIAY